MLTIERYAAQQHYAEWNDFITRSAAKHFMFRREYMEYHSDRFTDHSLIVRDEAGQIRALLPANFKADNKTLQSHGGLTFGGFQTSADASQSFWIELFQTLIEYLGPAGVVTLDYRPTPIQYYATPSQAELYALTLLGARLDKRVFYSVTDLREPLQLQTRRQRGAKKALAAGAEVCEESSPDAWRSYFSLLETVLLDRFGSKPVHSFDELWGLRNSFAAEIQLHTVRLGGEILAGVIIFETEFTAKTQYICTGEKGRDIGALDLLFQRLVTERFSGKRYFDFGSSANSADPSGFNRGLVEQKEGFGALSIVQDYYSLAIQN